ncbi:Glyco-hydro-79C domain-containing protein [Fusarium sp. LHS14.1]|nr:Glyco-hydro-79C domain-containing protein [Fusarium sp. LHS14.1]
MAYQLKYMALLFGYMSQIRATTVTYPVPRTVPSHAIDLDLTPVGVSFEFDMIATYMLNMSRTWNCMDHIDQFYDLRTPIRVGGTTQDRCHFDANFDGYFYRNPNDELSHYFGPRLFDLIGTYGGEVIVGFNRGDNNITNSLEAATAAKSRLLGKLWGVELGNEPDLYYSTWSKPVATAPWNKTQEGGNQAEWFQAFLNMWDGPLPILTGGNYAVPIELYPAYPNTDYLIDTAFNATVQAGVKMYNTHLYALSSADAALSDEMNHAKTVSDLSNYVEKIAKAKSAGRPYIIGETGFHGLETTQDATFGGAIQIIDKTLHALTLGIKRLYYHQGGLGANQASFNWWHLDKVEAPFYGGYFSALAISGGDKIIESDHGDDSFSQYVVYRNGHPYKAVLINTEYYSGTGNRTSATFELTGLPSSVAKALRMTASSSETTVETIQSAAGQPVIGGQYFSNKNCKLLGKRRFESVKVFGGKARITLAASEAVLLYL